MGAEPLVCRVLVPHVGAAPREGLAGLVLVGVPPRDGLPALVLVWDEAQNNPGASATNSIESVLGWLAQRWPYFPVHDAVVVERDSNGAFDHAYPKWHSGPDSAPSVQWTPLRWAGATSRSREAFLGLFTDNARRALAAAEALAG